MEAKKSIAVGKKSTQILALYLPANLAKSYLE
jgi:hypothetical protein